MVVDSDMEEPGMRELGAEWEASGLDLAEDLRRSVGRFVRAVRSVTDSAPAGHGEVLGALDRDGPQSIAELARMRGIKHQSMRVTVAELEDRGLVTRGPHPDDARSSLIAITDSGTVVLERGRAARRKVVARAANTSLTPAQREALVQVPGILEAMAAAVRDSA
ncbi:MarR family winged helix-turn-helix transcriptional regulator [Gordonia sp. DT30]|uniref:MarR family winged helix-turn-helix transcriptional regulator n=1 Tax=Gordonia sp. DT30 TaxID=3416546 RepID=UPI003CFB4CD1